MKEQRKNRKALIVCVAVLAVVLAATLACLLLLKGCAPEEDPTPTTTEAAEPAVDNSYELYWNLDRALYAGRGEDGGSSRVKEADGYYHVRFCHDGEIVVLKVASKKVMNKIDVAGGDDIIGLEFDEEGIVTGVKYVGQMRLRVVAYNCYVQEVDGKKVITNTTDSFDGEQLELELSDDTLIMDMTGSTGPVGCLTEVSFLDCIFAVQSLDGPITHVFVTVRNNYMQIHEAYCQHCQEDVTWYEWTNQNYLPRNNGHYQLQNHVQCTVQNNIASNNKVCLDLNGKVVSNRFSSRIYAVRYGGGELAIMDTSEDQSGKFVYSGDVMAMGTVVWIVNDAQLHMYGGTVDVSQAKNKSTGTAFHIGDGATFYLHDGTIIGGTSVCTYDANTDKYNSGMGGTLFVKGTFIMNGGTIQDGIANAGTRWKNGKANAECGYGGNIFMDRGSKMEMNGGVIKNGIAGGIAGNIFANGELTINGGIIEGGRTTGYGTVGGNIYVGGFGELTMNGGTIRNGTSFDGGGNLWVYGGGPKFTVNGGSIYGGQVYDRNTKELLPHSRNVFLQCCDFIMYGGYIDGGVQAVDNITEDGKATLYFGGSARITNDEDLCNLTFVPEQMLIEVDTMYDSAKIGISASGIFTKPTAKYNMDNFYSDRGADICYYEGCLAVGRVQCMCGAQEGAEHTYWCDQEYRLWNAWITPNKLPTATGYWYLIEDITLENATTRAGEDQNIFLDLSGFTVTALKNNDQGGSGRLYNLISADTTQILSITDTVGGGVMQRSDDETFMAQGGLLWGNQKSVINLYAGTLDGRNSVNGSDGGVIKTSGTFNMYGGVIQNGCAMYGGNVRVNAGVMNLYGGVIQNGSGYGANIFVNPDAVLNIYGGQILNGVGTSTNLGGNVGVHGTVVMSGGEISGGTVPTAGVGHDPNHVSSNVSIQNGTFIMSGGVIDGRIGIFNSTGNKLELSGTAVIWSDDEGANQLTCEPGLEITVKEMKEGAKIGLSASRGVYEDAFAVGAEGYTVTEKDRLCFVPGEENCEVRLENNGLYYIPEGMQKYCVCGGQAEGVGDHTCKNVVWLPWNGTDALPNTSGNYYLTGDVTVDKYYILRESLSLDLNGYTITSTTPWFVYRMADKADTLTITDSVGTGKIVKADGAAEYDKGDGTVGYGYNGGLLQVEAGTVKLFAGTLDGGNNQGEASGGLITVAGIFDMYGGTLQNGHAKSGGNIYISGTGVLNMYGGTVQGGQSVFGGNIYVATTYYKDTETYSYGTMNLMGGTVQGGIAAGGNIYMDPDTTLNISGGKIVDGIATNGNWGGNLAARGTVNMTGGEISGGKLHSGDGSYNENYQNANVHVQGTFNISGGVVDGRVFLYQGKLALSEDAQIWSDDMDAAQITLLEGNITVGQLGEDAKLGLTMTNAADTVLYAADGHTLTEADITHIHAGDGIEPVLVDNTVKFQIAGLRKQCVCGGKAAGVGDHVCEEVDFLPWDSKNSLPNAAGYYYLTEDVTLNTYYILRDTMALDLNGHTVTQNSNMFVYRMNDEADTFSIADSVGTGKIVKADGAGLVDGALLQIWAGTIKLYGGTLDGGENTGDVGGGILNISGGDFDMYGGTIQNGYALFGGNIRVQNGTMNLYGGTVQNGTGVGGNIFVDSKGALHIHGGKLLGGVARNLNWGGNLGVDSGVFTMTGGEISGGTVMNGSALDDNYRNANVQIQNAVMTMTGGTIDGRMAAYDTTDTTALKLSGTAKIWSDDADALQLDTTDLIIQVGDLTEGAKIGIHVVAKNTVLFAQDGYTLTEDEKTYFVFDSDGELTLADNKLNFSRIMANHNSTLPVGGVAEKAPIQHCLCGNHFVASDGLDYYRKSDEDCLSYTHEDSTVTGCDGSLLTWQPWTTAGALPNAAGNFYLTEAVELNTYYVARDTINLDLNGQTVTQKSNMFAYRMNDAADTFCITDSAGGGKMVKADGAGLVNGALMQVWAGTVKLFGGTLNGGENTGDVEGGILNIAGGSFHMYGGVIEKGYALFGGNIAVTSGTMNLYGGTVQNGTGVGANIYISGGTLNIHGGKITGGNARNGNWGGNLGINGATVNMTGGEISGGSYAEDTNYQNANVHIQGIFNMSGGCVDGRAWLYGGTLTVSGDAVIWSDDADAKQLTVHTNGTLIAGDLTENAKIGIDGVTEPSKLASAMVLEDSTSHTLTQQDADCFIHDTMTAYVQDNALHLKETQSN